MARESLDNKHIEWTFFRMLRKCACHTFGTLRRATRAITEHDAATASGGWILWSLGIPNANGGRTTCSGQTCWYETEATHVPTTSTRRSPMADAHSGPAHAARTGSGSRLQASIRLGHTASHTASSQALLPEDRSLEEQPATDLPFCPSDPNDNEAPPEPPPPPTKDQEG